MCCLLCLVSAHTLPTGRLRLNSSAIPEIDSFLHLGPPCCSGLCASWGLFVLGAQGSLWSHQEMLVHFLLMSQVKRLGYWARQALHQLLNHIPKEKGRWPSDTVSSEGNRALSSSELLHVWSHTSVAAEKPSVQPERQRYRWDSLGEVRAADSGNPRLFFFYRSLGHQFLSPRNKTLKPAGLTEPGV